MNNEATLIEYRWIQFPLHYNVIFDSVNYSIYFLFFKLPMGSIFFSFSLSKDIFVMYFPAFMHPAYLFPLSDIMTKLNHKWYTQNFLFNFIIWHLMYVHCPTIYVTSWVQPSQCHWAMARLLVMSVSSLQPLWEFHNATTKRCFRPKLGT